MRKNKIKNKEGLYVHIPFCNKICSYCNFSKVLYSKKFSQNYLLKLKDELHKYDEVLFNSIYIGGGTPTSLDEEELQFLFSILKPYQAENTSITIETNPDLSKNKIQILKQNNVKRISIGIQSFNPDILNLINREANYEDIKKLIATLIENDIRDINVDLIYGFNIESLETLKKDLDLFTALNITHISTYCLQLEEKTILANSQYQELDEEKIREQYDFIVDYLAKKGFYRYEVSNFSKQGFESKHNLIYWNNQEYGGVGLNASSYIDNVRRTNTKNLQEYLKGNYEDYEEVLSLADKEFYFLMLGLRKEKGISKQEYFSLFNKDIYINHSTLKELVVQGDIIDENGFIRINPQEIFILDFILRKLLFD